MRYPRWLPALALLVVVGCGTTQRPHQPVTISMLAVLPVETAVAGEGDGETARDRPAEPPPPEGAAAVTAQLYRALAEQTEFRFVPDLTVADAVRTPAVRGAPDLVARAVALGRAVGADAVIVGRLYRFQKRVGTQFGATQTASVSFALALVAVTTGEEIWRGAFDETQQPLTFDLLKWWMFWEAGPRFMSASELAGLGVDRLFPALLRAARSD